MLVAAPDWVYTNREAAAKTLAEFAATVRDEVDLNKLTDRLIAVVEETMQPARISLWLKPTADGRRRSAIGGHILRESSRHEQ